MAENNEKKRISPVRIIVYLLLAAIILTVSVLFLPDYIRYNNALDALSRGNYTEAREMFGTLGDYIDCPDRYKYCDYCIAGELYNAGEYAAAAESFIQLNGYMDSSDKADECNYQLARQLILNGNTDEALSILQALGSYKDAYVLMLSMLSGNSDEIQLERLDLTTALDFVLPLKDSTDPQTYIDIFRNNIPDGIIATGFSHTVALCSDGTVLAAGDNTYGQCDTQDWQNIVSIAAGGNFTIGLCSDGTIVATGDNSYGQLDITTAGKATAIFAGNTACAAVLGTGNILTYGYGDFSETATWPSANNLSVGAYSVSGIDSAGKLLTTDNQLGECDHPDALYSIYMGTGAWMAVTKDGASYSSFDGFNLSGGVIYGSIGTRYAAALMHDGTVNIHAFIKADRNTADLSQWSDFIAVSSRGAHVVAVRADGTVIAVGDNSSGQCDISQWDLF